MLQGFRARQLLQLALILTVMLGLGAYRYYRIVPALRFVWAEKTWGVLLIMASILLVASIALVFYTRKSVLAKREDKHT